jgi:hypothetical protein
LLKAAVRHHHHERKHAVSAIGGRRGHVVVGEELDPTSLAELD